MNNIKMDGQWWLGDCLELMTDIPDGSIDMILCDLPYGTTQNKWDTVIPFEPLWEHYWRVCKPNAAVVLTAQAPFDKMLGASQIQHFKYEWIWEKPLPTGHLNSKIQPMKAHENVLIFYRKQCPYNPQMVKNMKPSANFFPKEPVDSYSDNYGKFKNYSRGGKLVRFPRSVQKFNTTVHEKKRIHPTQKPVALFEYLIRTYTNEGETVLDNTAGSGTTAIACQNTKRRWICIEKEKKYTNAALHRILTNPKVMS